MRALITAAVAALTITPTTATPQGMVCGQRDKIAQELAERYGEVPVFGGLSMPDAVVEVFASRKTETWTITITGPNNRACVIAVGQGLLVPVPEGDPT